MSNGGGKGGASRGPIVVVGLSHKSAPVDIREKLAVPETELPGVLAELMHHEHVGEAMFLSTCNRVEAYVAPKRSDVTPSELAHAIKATFTTRTGGVRIDDMHLYDREGDEAVRHIFRVAASLDSMVLGEPQILGQVKDAYDVAVEHHALGHFLGRCVHRAFTVAKRVRTETALGAGTVSISSVAVDLAKRIFGDLADHTVLLVGAGEMAEAAAKSLGKGAKSIRVCNRSLPRAAELAAQFGGAASKLESLEDELTLADVVVTSTGSPTYVVTRDMVKRVMKARKGRTLFFVDIAVPRNVEPEIHKIDNVYVFNVDDLEGQVKEAMKARKAEVAAAELIVAKELDEFRVWARGLDVAPTVVALRAKTKAVLATELDRTLGGRLKHLPEGDRAALAQMIESAVNKLLHMPTTRLKQATASEDGSTDLVRAVQHLFDLPEVVERDDATEQEGLARTGTDDTGKPPATH
jgi:glutamyl-tRNA reductase